MCGYALPRGPQPAVTIQLADIGFQGVPQALVEAGASMLTVHFVDNTHLLVTYGLRGLVERIPDDPPDDNDCAVGAVLVDLPTGKVLARARWHLHDHGQYLWSLGNGRFLLRIRSTLTAIAPLANVDSKDPFEQMPFVHVPGVIDAVLVSPEGDLVTVEASSPRKPRPEHPVLMVHDDEPKETPHEVFYFVRAMGTGAAGSPVRAVAAGSVRTASVGLLPVNGRGYLFAESEKRIRWNMQFDSFDGDTRKLTYVDSSCPPRMQFVSPSQFVVFSCRGSDEKIMISAFNFAARETWEELLGGSTPFAHFAFAPQSGRFALSRTVSMASMPMSSLGPGALTTIGSVGGFSDPSSTQEVRIYQVESGDLLLKLSCVPVSPGGQNFDLSADGMSVLVVRNGAIEVYKLPAPSEQDKKDLEAMRALEPPMPHTENVKLTRMLAGAPIEEPPVSTAESTQPAAPKPVAAPAAKVDEAAATSAPLPAAAPAASAPANPAGDAMATAGDVETHRKPPSLLNPGETIDSGKKASRPE